jgi:hypothetical protein
MRLLLLLEARKPDGTVYRLGLRCSLDPTLASMLGVIIRLLLIRS